MVRRPDTSDTLVDTRYRLIDPLVLLPIGVTQQLGLLENLRWLHVLDADSLLKPVDVVADHDGMFSGPWGNRKLNGWVGGGEVLKVGFNKGIHASGAS